MFFFVLFCFGFCFFFFHSLRCCLSICSVVQSFRTPRYTHISPGYLRIATGRVRLSTCCWPIGLFWPPKSIALLYIVVGAALTICARAGKGQINKRETMAPRPQQQQKDCFRLHSIGTQHNKHSIYTTIPRLSLLLLLLLLPERKEKKKKTFLFLFIYLQYIRPVRPSACGGINSKKKKGP